MTVVLVLVLTAVGIVLCAGALLLLLQAVTSLLPQRDVSSSELRPDFVVLIPAHDEALVIEETVHCALSLIGPEGRLLVVADNCSDDTAARARAAGAEVIERHAPQRRAKGFALAYGIEHLRAAPPQVLVILDADCHCTRGTFQQLVVRAQYTATPVQAINLMTAPHDARLSVRIAAFAWAFKNQTRPSGFAWLNLPCQLTGTGMALPWQLVEQVDFATASIVEDLQLGLRFAAAGHAPVLCTQVQVQSSFPQSASGEHSQRRRWEHGHLQTIASLAPPLAVAALRTGNVKLMALVADLTVPPLALFALLLGAYAAGTAISWMLGLPCGAALSIGCAALGAFAAAVVVGWWQVGRQWVSMVELLATPLYMARKLPLYLGFIKGRQTEWTRTKRGL